jgi:hypothetical protein
MHRGFNIEFSWDFSHGCWGDTKQSLKDSGLFPLFLLWLVTFNVPHGPWNDDARFVELKASWEMCMANFDAKTCVLFQEQASRLGKILKRSGHDFDSSEDMDTQLWEIVKAESPLLRKGHRSNLNRFFEGTGAMRAGLKTLPIKQFQFEFLGVESGVVSTKKMVKFLQAPLEEDDAAAGKATTDPNKACISDKAIRGCAHNALAISIATMSDVMNQLLLTMILSVTFYVEEWYRYQNFKLRSVVEVREWVLDQLDGGFMRHLVDTFGTLSSPGVLEECCFAMPARKKIMKKTVTNDADAEYSVDNILADYMGRLVLNTVSNRIVRTYWFLRGWPSRMSLVAGSNAVALQTLLKFKNDLDAFRGLQAIAEKDSSQVLIDKRSVFHHLPVEQYVQVARPAHVCIQIQEMQLGYTHGPMAYMS